MLLFSSLGAVLICFFLGVMIGQSAAGYGCRRLSSLWASSPFGLDCSQVLHDDVHVHVHALLQCALAVCGSVVTVVGMHRAMCADACVLSLCAWSVMTCSV